ncbi:hypothetical protein D2T31_11940 [Sinirhodobacter populi]|uniref:Uncharacterized protein n=1 Tax=Paenirhodobacter populi TaxID=2306993 RepID=A0A443K7R3_9RHOB|nr:hypothetical protein [Sinirhodobacter populi]RWR28817.1 hypothetical protein D2T31_11940 [Sinirhodobacter populi]
MTYRIGLPVLVTFPELGPPASHGTITAGPVLRKGVPCWKVDTRTRGEGSIEVWVPEDWLQVAVRGV